MPSVHARRSVLTLTATLLRVSEGVRGLLKESAEAEGLTPAQAQALRFVARTKTFMTSIGNLAAALGTTHVSAVKVASGLERRGLLTREASPWDRRVSLLRLTAEGERVLERLRTFEEALERSLGGLSAAERRAVEPALAAIVQALQQSGAIVVSEPCRGCVYFVENDRPGAAEPHRCRLVERHISERESLLECPDHTPVAA